MEEAYLSMIYSQEQKKKKVKCWMFVESAVQF